MAEDSGQEKSEEPTAKRLRDAREKGDIVRSRELTTTVLLLAASGGLLVFGGRIGLGLEAVMSRSFTLDRQDYFDPASMFDLLGSSIMEMVWSLALYFFLLLVAAIVGPILLGGWNFSGKAIAPKGSRMDPLAGIKRMFSLKSLVELFKGLAKFLVVGSICVVVLLSQEKDLLSMGAEDVSAAMLHGVTILGWSFLLMCAAMILITAVDVPFQMHDHAEKLRMTMQEVKDEMKNTEGKPEVKGRIRQLQHEMAQRRMMSAVPDADVVITNPTHFSVALKYDQNQDAAPILLAKGGDHVALKIREIAKANGVPIVSAPPLARAVYFHTELDEEIPEGLFVAVAQILAYVYQLEQYQKRRAPRPGMPEDFPIPEAYRHDADEPDLP